MNVVHEDKEFVDVELRGSGHNMQNNDPPPKFTGTNPSEFKSYREKVRRWLLFTRTPAQLQGPHVWSRLTGPAWDACDGLEPEDVATADGVNMILGTLAEAFPGEYDVNGSHTVYFSKEARVKSEEQEGYVNVETTLAALEQESDTDLEETDVQETLLAYNESRQLRGRAKGELWLQARVGAYQWRETLSNRSADLAYTLPPVVRRDTGQAHARTKENKCPEMVKRRRHHSLSASEDTTARQVTLATE